MRKGKLLCVFFRITDYDDYRHYSDKRSLVWVKTHVNLLDTYAWCRLTEVQRCHVISLRLLAAKYENRLPLDQHWLKQRLSAKKKIDVDVLAAAGFLEYIQEDTESHASDLGQTASDLVPQSRKRAELSRAEGGVAPQITEGENDRSTNGFEHIGASGTFNKYLKKHCGDED